MSVAHKYEHLMHVHTHVGSDADQYYYWPRTLINTFTQAVNSLDSSIRNITYREYLVLDPSGGGVFLTISSS